MSVFGFGLARRTLRADLTRVVVVRHSFCGALEAAPSVAAASILIKIENDTSSCDINNFAEPYSCVLRVILRSRVLLRLVEEAVFCGRRHGWWGWLTFAIE